MIRLNLKKLTGAVMAALLTVTAAFSIAPNTVMAAEGPAVSLVASNTAPKAGEEFTVDVNMSGNTGIVAMNVYYTFDTEKLEFVSQSETGLLKNYITYSGWKGTEGTFVWGWSADSLCEKDGKLATITLKAKEDVHGDVAINVTNATGVTSDMKKLVFSEGSVSISIGCNHKFDEGKVTTEATCTEKGVKTFTCKTCQGTKTEEIKATGHAWDEGKVTTEATCTEKGVKTFTCKTCQETKTEEIKATGHAWDEGKVTTEATCTEKGVKTFTCKTCQETKTEEIKAAGHAWDEGKITKEATEKEEGEKLYTCKNCEETKTEVIAKKTATEVKPGATDKNTKADTTNKTTLTKGTVKTGDNSNVILWCVLLGAACVVGGVTYNMKRKTK